MKKILALLLSLIIFVTSFTALPMTAHAKRQYANYDAVCDVYWEKAYDGIIDCNSLYFNYLKLRTPYGKQKTLTLLQNSAEGVYTIIFIKRKNGKAVKYQKIHGGITKYSKNRKYLLCYENVGSRLGGYYIYKYNSKKKRYVKKAFAMFDENGLGGQAISQRSALIKVQRKANVSVKNFKNFNSSKYELFTYGDFMY